MNNVDEKWLEMQKARLELQKTLVTSEQRRAYTELVVAELKYVQALHESDNGRAA